MRAFLNFVFEHGLPFLTFLAAAVAITWRERRGDDAAQLRPWIHALLVVSLLASFGAALLSRNAWPFCKWPLVAGTVGETVTHPRLLAVDREGVEYGVDWRAWQPIPVDELTSWMHREMPELEEEERVQALRYLLDRLERARRRSRAGGSVGTFDSLLGPFTAPMFLLHPSVWSGPDSTPSEPFVGLRLYHERWNVEHRAASPDDEGVVERVLRYEVLIP